MDKKSICANRLSVSCGSLSLWFQLVRTGHNRMDTRQCQCQPGMVCLQSGSLSADGAIHFFFLVCISYFQKPSLEKKKKKSGGGYFSGRFLGDELACGDV